MSLNSLKCVSFKRGWRLISALKTYMYMYFLPNLYYMYSINDCRKLEYTKCSLKSINIKILELTIRNRLNSKKCLLFTANWKSRDQNLVFTNRNSFWCLADCWLRDIRGVPIGVFTLRWHIRNCHGIISQSNTARIFLWIDTTRRTPSVL